MIALLARVISRLKDSPTGLYAVGTRIVGAAVSFIGGILILVVLDPGRIGVFLSFTNLAGFSLVADLGLTYSLLLAVSAHRSDAAAPVAWAAFAAALPTVALTGVALFVGGALFMLEGDVSSGQWLAPWIAFCVISSVQVVLSLGLGFAEGSGGRRAVWKANLWIEIAAGVAFLAMIAADMELWSVAAGAAVRVILIFLALARIFGLPARPAAGSAVALWRRELWPMQWKTLLNNLMGLATTRLMTPLLLAAQGQVIAGQVGLVLTLNYLLVTVTAVWPLSQIALFTDLHWRGEHAEFSATFRRTMLASLGLSILAAIGAGLMCELMRRYSPHIAARLPHSTAIWLILVAAPFAHLSTCFAIAIRSGRVDPVVLPNLLLGCIILPALWFAARQGAETFAAGYFATNLIFLVLYGYFFVRVRRSTISGGPA